MFTIKLPDNYLLTGNEKCRISDINGKLVSVVDLEKDKGADAFFSCCAIFARHLPVGFQHGQEESAEEVNGKVNSGIIATP